MVGAVILKPGRAFKAGEDANGPLGFLRTGLSGLQGVGPIVES